VRAARLLLVASAASCIGILAYILSVASGVSPFLAFFVLAALLFIGAAASLERAPERARPLAWAGACLLLFVGTLAGFGAGFLTFPAILLGCTAAIRTHRATSERAGPAARPLGRLRWLVAVYLLVGLVLALWRFAMSSSPAPSPPGAALGVLWGAFLWPLLFGPSSMYVVLFALPGVALAIAAMALLPRSGDLGPPRRGLGIGGAGGLLVVGIEVGLAYARASSSAWFELGVAPLVLLFAAGGLLGAGLWWSRSGARAATVAVAIGGAVVLYALFSRPTVECMPNGVSTSAGPWWLPQLDGRLSSSGSSSSGHLGSETGSGGVIRRGDGVVITYRCAGGTLVEFEIARP